MLDLGHCYKNEEKSYITVIYEDKENRVTWFSDTSIEDVRFALICACDSLVDGEFEVLDDKAKLIDINTTKLFRNGSIYFVRKKNNTKPTNILLDGNRKLYFEIEPMSHIESQVALKYMIVGSNLLKHSRNGYPHIRMFQLSNDLRRILWYTKSKSITEAHVSFENITEIVIGQHSDNFLRYPLKMLEEYSFSVIYTRENKTFSLDITCKDEREFDLWLIGLKALHSHFLKKIINKYNLLCHSKCFQEQIKKGNIGQSSKFLFYEIKENFFGNNNLSKDYKRTETPKGKKNLENFIVSRNLNQYEIAKLLLQQCEKTKALRNDVKEVSQINEFDTGEKKHDYQMVFAEEAIVDDLDTQRNQMVKLYRNCEIALGYHLQEFLWFTKEHKLNLQYNIDEEDYDEFMKIIVSLEIYLQLTFICEEDLNPNKINLEYFIKELDIKLWKIEIDIENVGDIINRFRAPNKKGLLEKIKNIFKIFK